MKSSKGRIAFKVLIGYFILGVLATISGVLVLSETKTFTELQQQGISDRGKIVKMGSLIAEIYKNESLARAAIQSRSSVIFSEYIKANKQLLQKLDSLGLIINDAPQGFILDSIKLIIDRKLKNINDLKNLKLNDNSDKSISNAINKLGSIDSLLGKVTIGDLVEDPESLDQKTRERFQDYVRILNKYNPQSPIGSEGQQQIDSLISISKNMLEEAQEKTNNQRKYLEIKERELIENDLAISRKLQELLDTLEKGIILYTNTMNEQSKATLGQSKKIIFVAAGISFVIITIFSMIILNDFWKSQRYRMQLEQANQTTSSLLESREQLISMVSHDLRTPLSTIIGYGELLQNSTQSSKEKNYIEHIQNASAYMSQLVEELLEFSKLENGKTSIESIPFNLKKHLEEIGQSAQNLIKDKPIDLVINHDSSIDSPIVSDPFRLKQILYNLVVNACKFTHKGSITIESNLKQENNKNSLQISISDTGIGIDKSQQEAIFKAFNQGDNGKGNKHNGFGLGLTISKKLTELLGGTLVLKSALGKGSTFILKIPVAISEKPLLDSNTSNPQVFYNLKSIVIEDDASMRQLLKDLLKQYGIETKMFSNAKIALETIEDDSYDIVLTDIQLPKMNGIHFMELLKKQNSYRNQPIIAMTGRSNLAVDDYISSGFSDVLTKPFQPNQLFDVLQKYFRPISSDVPEIRKVEHEKINGFSVDALSFFVNHDTKAIENTLRVFLKDTKRNMVLLKEAKKNNNIDMFNNVSHKMLSMFRQLDVKTIIPFLEMFEIDKAIDNDLFENFKSELGIFVKSVERYLN